MYTKLAGVARGSLGELLEDYEDYARQNNIEVWPLEKGRAMREISKIRDFFTPYHPYIPSLPDSTEEAVNLLITLINQTNYLLDRLIFSLEQKFIRKGGYSENLLKNRLEEKSKK